MRRRLPRVIELRRQDKPALETLAQSGGVVHRVARRARVLLAMARRHTVVQALAQQVQMTRHAIWYLCRRYEKRGLAALQDAPRSGRPRRFSPFGPGAGRTTGVL